MMKSPRPPTYALVRHRDLTISPRKPLANTLPDIHNRGDQHHLSPSDESPRTELSTALVGPTAQIRELLREYNPVMALREIITVIVKHKATYGPPLTLLTREYDRVVEEIAEKGLGSLRDVTLFEDITAANERYRAEKRNASERERLGTEVERLEKQVKSLNAVIADRVRDINDLKTAMIGTEIEAAEQRSQTESLSTMLRQTKEEIKMMTVQHSKVHVVHNAAIANMERRGIEKANELNAKINEEQKKNDIIKEKLKEAYDSRDQTLSDISVLENRVHLLKDSVEARDKTIAEQAAEIAKMKADFAALEAKYVNAKEVLERIKFMQDCTRAADKVPGIGAYLTLREADRLKPFEDVKNFTAMGTAEDVPCFLAGNGKVDYVPISYQDTRSLLEEVINAYRLEPWTTQSVPMPKYFHQKMLQRHLNDSAKTLQASYSCMHVATQFSWDARMDALKKIVHGTIPAVILGDLNNLMATLRLKLKKCEVSEDVRRAIIELYPTHGPHFLGTMFQALQRDSVKGLSVAELIDSNAGRGDQPSMFLNEMCHLFVIDAMEFRGEVMAALEGACDMASDDGSSGGAMMLSYGKALRTIRSVDPDRSPEACTELVTKLFQGIVNQTHSEPIVNKKVRNRQNAPPGVVILDEFPPLDFHSAGVQAVLQQLSLIRVGPIKESTLMSAKRRPEVMSGNVPSGGTIDLGLLAKLKSKLGKAKEVVAKK